MAGACKAGIDFTARAHVTDDLTAHLARGFQPPAFDTALFQRPPHLNALKHAMARGFILYGYPPRHVMEAVLGFETFVRARARAPVERARAAPGIIHDACVKLAAMRVAPRGATLTAAFMASRAPEGAGARARAGARPLEDIAAAVVAGDAVAFFVLLRNCPRLYARGARPGSWEVVAVVRALFPHVSPAHFQLVQLVLGEACALALLADIVWPAGGALDAEGAINTQLVQAVAAQLCAEVPRSVEALVRPPGRRFSRPDEFGKKRGPP